MSWPAQRCLLLFGCGFFAQSRIHLDPSSDGAEGIPGDLLHTPDLRGIGVTNAILVASDTTASDIRLQVLLCSFRRFVPSAHLFLFLPQGVALPSSGDRVHVVAAWKRPELPVQWYRWIWFQVFLRHWHFPHVILCDAFDVVFQSDPFALARPRPTLFISGEAYSLSMVPMNLDWLYFLYNDQIVNLFRHAPVLNSGFTMGNFEAMIAYLDAMVKECMLRLFPRRFELSDKPSWHGMDQGIHNVIVHLNLIKGNFTLVARRDLFLMCNGVKSDFHYIKRGAIVYKTNWKPYPVVHQYNRIPDLNGSFRCKGKVVPDYCKTCSPLYRL